MFTRNYNSLEDGMKKEFKLGDRVFSYGYDKSGTLLNKAVVIVGMPCDNVLLVQHIAGGWQYEVHPKQCRRLIKRKKKKIVPRFVGWNNTMNLSAPMSKIKSPHHNCAIFIIEEKYLTPELREKYKITE